MKHKSVKKKLYSGLLLSVPLVSALLSSLLLLMVSSCLTDAHEHYYRPTLDNGGYTICRLKKVEKVHESFRGRQQRQYWCLYEGANGSGGIEIMESIDACPREIVCLYDPKEKRVTIKDLMNAMKDAFK
jgi:hypothetical protein